MLKGILYNTTFMLFLQQQYYKLITSPNNLTVAPSFSALNLRLHKHRFDENEKQPKTNSYVICDLFRCNNIYICKEPNLIFLLHNPKHTWYPYLTSYWLQVCGAHGDLGKSVHIFQSYSVNFNNWRTVDYLVIAYHIFLD